MKNYAYLDRANILHVVKDEKTAMEFSINGKVVETDVECRYGFPVVKLGDVKDEIFVYGLEEAYFGGNMKSGKEVSLTKFPEIFDLYRKVM